MTLTNDPSAPLVAVVGATGYQGGSVIDNIIESDKAYRLRALTRDASKPAALKLKEQGVEVVAVNIVAGNEAAVREAFSGAEVIFAVTNFWEHTNVEREVAEGKLMLDAAKAAGAKLLVWSGLEDYSEGTYGAKMHVVHFDGKAAVTAYAFGQLPTVDVQAGFYMTNITGPLFSPQRRADGSYLWDFPLAGDPRAFPFIDIARDYGLFVRYAIETPDSELRAGGKAIYTYGENITHAQAAAVIESVRGVKISIKPKDVEEYLAGAAAAGMPPMVVDDLRDTLTTGAEYGYYFGKEACEEQQEMTRNLPRRPRTFEEFLHANPGIYNV